MAKDEASMKEYNVQFGVLTFLATMLVIFGHTGISLGTFEWLFHFDTFHMPLFVFISGYFFKTHDICLSNMGAFLKKKIKKLIIPFFVFNLLYGLLAVILYYKFNFVWCNGNNFWHYLIVQPFTYGTDFFGFNSPAWFVLMLFWVELFVYILYLIFNKLKSKHIIISMLTLVGAFLAIYISKNYEKTATIVFATRTLYMMFWVSLGIIYKKYLEKHDNLPSLLYFAIIFLIQFAILIINNGHEMNAFIYNGTFTQNSLITIILAINGIALYLRLSKILCDSLGKRKLVIYIQKNSFSVMMHQMFGFFLLNLIFFKLSNFVSSISFNYDGFRSSQFYRVYPYGHPAFDILYVIAGLGVSLLIAYITGIIKKAFQIVFSKKDL
ncbi:MAG: acyltransferase [Bacilli bacterium]|nr:acyltransferase [Bacilli bacterium]